MDLFNVLTYLNKLSLVAFFVTAVVLIYQVVIMKKDGSKKNSTPVIPNFDENMAVPVKNFTSINEEKIISKTKPVSKSLLFSIVGVTVICLTLVVYLINKQNKQVEISSNQTVPTPTVVIVKPTILPTSVTIPTRIPTTYNKETVIAYVTPKSQPTESSMPTVSATASPTKTSSLPLTGAVENSLIITAVSAFMILFAFVF